MKELLLTQKEMNEMVPAFDEHLLFALERRYFDFLRPERLELTNNDIVQNNFDSRTDLRVIRMDEISHEGEADIGLHLMHFQNVIASMKDDSHNVVSVIHGDGLKTSLYYGLAKRRDIEGTLGTDQYAKMLGQTIHGNFLGAKFTSLSAAETQREVVTPMLEHQNIMAFPGIPSLRDPKGPYVQGMDRFIEAMRGEKYVLVCIAEPITVPMVDGMIKNLFDLTSDVHSNVKATVQRMKGSSDTVNVGMFGMRGTMSSDTGLGGGGVLGLLGGLLGAAAVVVSPVIAASLPIAVAVGATSGIAQLVGKAISSVTTKLQSFNLGSLLRTTGETSGFGGTGGYARSWNRSTSVSQETLNRTAMYCEQLCESYIKRLQRGKNLGFWNVGIYLLTSDKYTQLRGHGLLRASLAGDETYWEPMRALQIQSEAAPSYLATFNNPKYDLLLHGIQKTELQESVSFGTKMANLAKKITGGSVERLLEMISKSDDKTSTEILEQIRREPDSYSPEVLEKAWKEVEAADIGHPLGPALGGIGTPLNTEELSIIMNLPRREVQGITLREAPAFGVNYATPNEESVRVGRVVHKRKPLDELPYQIPRALLQKHAFVCGVTGSGKTNTCFRLLRDTGLPFMVIEPAKTEYRQLLKKIPNLKIFTLGSENISPFRINPFEFVPGSEILTHIDSLKAVFSAAFPMYAAMPFILEEAIIEIYRDKGWELATSTNSYLEDVNSERFFDFLPTLQDLYEKIDDVVNSKNYAAEQSMNYMAALKARISSLITGSKGLMLNTRRSTPIETLLNERVVIELKYIGDDEEKCFLMGLLLSAIYEYRENRGGIGSPLSHVLLIEEAHRLLKKVPEYVSPEVGNSRGKAVETFTNVISEIREFGQGLIVVDQIPSKLAEDVIKNTNIKIVHRTLAKDDRDYVGATMNLNDEQSRELCLLEVGQAVIHREGMDKAFLVQIDREKQIGDSHVTDSSVRETMQEFHKENSYVFMRYPGFEKRAEIHSAYTLQDFRKFETELYLPIIGAFMLSLIGKHEKNPTLKKIFYSRLERLTRKNGEVERDCYAIYYSTQMFSNLNKAFPGCYDRCVSMHKQFVNFWFDGTGNADELRQNMEYLVMDGHITSPFFAYYTRNVDQETPAQLKKIWSGSESDYLSLENLLDSGIRKLLPEVVLSADEIHRLKKDFLRVIFAGDPRRAEILKKLKEGE